MPYGLDCRACPRDHKCNEWKKDSTSYRYDGAELMGLAWDKCPASYLNDSHLLIALDLVACNKVAPLERWPSGWSHWVVKYVTGIHQAAEDRKLLEVEKHGHR